MEIVINEWENDWGFEGLEVRDEGGLLLFATGTSSDSPEDNSLNRLGISSGIAIIAEKCGATVKYISKDPDTE